MPLVFADYKHSLECFSHLNLVVSSQLGNLTYCFMISAYLLPIEINDCFFKGNHVCFNILCFALLINVRMINFNCWLIYKLFLSDVGVDPAPLLNLSFCGFSAIISSLNYFNLFDFF